MDYCSIVMMHTPSATMAYNILDFIIGTRRFKAMKKVSPAFLLFFILLLLFSMLVANNTHFFYIKVTQRPVIYYVLEAGLKVIGFTFIGLWLNERLSQENKEGE